MTEIMKSTNCQEVKAEGDIVSGKPPVILCGSNGKPSVYSDFISIFKEQYHIVGIHDKSISYDVDRISNVPVLHLEIDKLNCFCVIMNCGWDIVAAELTAVGKRRYFDFETEWYLELEDKNCIPYVTLREKSRESDIPMMVYLNYLGGGRKTASVFGNCQGEYVVNMLLRVKAFVSEYFLVKLPNIAFCDEEIKKNGFHNDFLQQIDLFFFQNIQDANRFSPRLSSSFILGKLKNACKKYAFPNTYFIGYFPQYIFNKYNFLMVGKESNIQLVPYGDSVMERFLLDNVAPGAAWQAMQSDGLFSERDIWMNFEKSLGELKRREKACDVVISDYIAANYQRIEICFSPNHPSNAVMEEVTKRLLSKIGISVEGINTEGISENDHNECIIYPCVKKTLNLTFDKLKYKFSDRIYFNQKMGIPEYMSLYSEYCITQYAFGKQAFDIMSKVWIDEEICSCTEESEISVRNGYVHLLLCLELKRDLKQGTVIVQLPKGFTSAREYITTGFSFSHGQREHFLVRIKTDGDMELLNDVKVKSMVIKTGFHLK